MGIPIVDILSLILTKVNIKPTPSKSSSHVKHRSLSIFFLSLFYRFCLCLYVCLVYGACLKSVDSAWICSIWIRLLSQFGVIPCWHISLTSLSCWIHRCDANLRIYFWSRTVMSPLLSHKTWPPKEMSKTIASPSDGLPEKTDHLWSQMRKQALELKCF